MKTSEIISIVALVGVGYLLLRKKNSGSIIPNSLNTGNTIPTTDTIVVPTTTNTATTTVKAPIDTTVTVPVKEVSSTGQVLFVPPVNTTWVNPPASLDVKGKTNTNFGYTTQDSVNANPDIALLIKNPSIKSKNNYYIDQYGNLIQSPTKVFPDGVLTETAERIAQWRKANGITV